jgi:hypothetical protein
MIRQTMMIAFVSIAYILALCVSVEGGNIRGQSDRILKKEDKENGDVGVGGGGGGGGGGGSAITITIAPQPSPTDPPTPSQSVVLVVPADTNQVIVPVPVPVPVPVLSPTSTPPPQGTTTNPPVDNLTTMENCPPDLPTSGDLCIVPSGFLYQSCDYTWTLTIEGDRRVPRCSCRADEGLFMCLTVPFLPPTSQPTPQPITVAVTTQSPMTTAPTMTPSTMTLPTIEPIQSSPSPPPVPVQSSSPLSNDLPLHCYVSGMEDQSIQQLPQTGDSCFVPDDIEFGNCVFAVNDPEGVYLFIVYRCLCNPRKLPDETYLDKFICNVIINEPF